MGDLTTLLETAARGDRRAFDQAYALVYDELHELAHGQRSRWRGDETLNTTALVHEAYLKLADWTRPRWRSRRHFLAVAARAMRQILVNYAERRRAAKRGGDLERVDGAEERAAVESGAFSLEAAEEILALHAALERLEEVDERQCRVVECRFFADLTIPETAEALGVSPATVKRDWRLASAWLYRELEGKAAAADER
ncbi:MAG: ECF-type sigma factor [Gemmatimonadota bacterium]